MRIFEALANHRMLFFYDDRWSGINVLKGQLIVGNTFLTRNGLPAGWLASGDGEYYLLEFDKFRELMDNNKEDAFETHPKNNVRHTACNVVDSSTSHCGKLAN